jgi:hypothetical protein
LRLRDGRGNRTHEGGELGGGKRPREVDPFGRQRRDEVEVESRSVHHAVDAGDQFAVVARGQAQLERQQHRRGREARIVEAARRAHHHQRAAAAVEVEPADPCGSRTAVEQALPER